MLSAASGAALPARAYALRAVHIHNRRIANRIAHHRVKATYYRREGHVPKAVKHDALADALPQQLTCVWRVLMEVALVSHRSLRVRTLYPKAARTIATTLSPPSPGARRQSEPASPRPPLSVASPPSPHPVSAFTATASSIAPAVVMTFPLSPPSTASSSLSPSSTHLAVPASQRRLSLNASQPLSPFSGSEPSSPGAVSGGRHSIPAAVLSALHSLQALPVPPLASPAPFPLTALSSFRLLHTLGAPPHRGAQSEEVPVPPPDRLGRRRVSAVNMGREVEGVDVQRLAEWFVVDGADSPQRRAELSSTLSSLGSFSGLAVPTRRRARSSSSGGAAFSVLRLADDDDDGGGGGGSDSEADELSAHSGLSGGESQYSDFDGAAEDDAQHDATVYEELKDSGEELSLMQRLALTGLFRSSHTSHK